MRDNRTPSNREDQKKIGTEEALQEETCDKEDPHDRKEPIRAEVLLRDAPIDSVEEKHKSQKKGLFSFGTAREIEIEGEQDDSEDKDVAVGQKVRFILEAFSADHDIFWFR